MFGHYSKRALRVVFAARISAGQRGSDILDVGDLELGLVIEDQGKVPELAFGPMSAEDQVYVGTIAGSKSGSSFVRLESHPSFFSTELAEHVLVNVRKLLPQSKPIPTSADLPISAELGRVFESAEELRTQFPHEQVEPLHLLASVLKMKRDVFADELQKARITHQSVIAKQHEGGASGRLSMDRLHARNPGPLPVAK